MTDPGVISETQALSRIHGMATRSIQDFFDAHGAGNPSLSRAPFSGRRTGRASLAAARSTHPRQVFQGWSRTTDSVVRAATTTYNTRFLRTRFAAHWAGGPVTGAGSVWTTTDSYSAAPGTERVGCFKP